MPVNPFQATAEMQWGGYESKKSYRSQGQMGDGSLARQGNRSQANYVAPTVGELKPTPKASGRMPEGNANIGRANYGKQQTEQPQRQGRTASFGGMGAGATKGGSGMTAGGDISFDLSIGKTQTGDIKGSVGALGMGATTKDSMVGSKIDQSQKYAPTFAGGKAGSSRAGAGAAGRGGAGGNRSGAGAGAGGGGAGGAGRGGAGGNAARGGDVGDSMADFSGVKFGNPTAQVGRNKFTGRDDMSDNRKTTTVKTTTDARKMPPAKEGPASKKPDPKKPATATEKPASKPAAKTPSKPATKPAEKPAAKPAEKPKEEAKKKEAVKDKAKKSVAEAVKKGPAAAKTKKKTAGKVTKEEEE